MNRHIPTNVERKIASPSTAETTSVRQESPYVNSPGKHLPARHKASFWVAIAGVIVALAGVVVAIVAIRVNETQFQESGANPVVAQMWSSQDIQIQVGSMPSLSPTTVLFVLIVNNGRSPVEIADVNPRMPDYVFATDSGCNNKPFTVQPNSSGTVVIELPGNTFGTVAITEANGTEVTATYSGKYPENAGKNFQSAFADIKEQCFHS